MIWTKRNPLLVLFTGLFAILATLFALSALQPAALAAAKKKKKPAPETAAPAAADEPAVPSKLNAPIYCSVPDEVPEGSELKFRCAARGEVKASELKLSYRSANATNFESVAMEKSAQGWYVVVLPGTAVQGHSLQYYVEATKSNGDVAAANGRAESPNIVYIKVPPPPVTAQATIAAAVEPAHMGRRRLQSYWIGIGIGSGYGWHPSSSLEYREDLAKPAGWGGAGPIFLTPEFGYQATQNFAFSIQGRDQIIFGSGTDPMRGGHPSRGAHTLLLRGHYFLTGTENTHLYVTGIFGVGEGFRFTFGPNDPPGALTNDTIRSGPVVLGPGAGYVWDFTERLAADVELNWLTGLPNTGTVFDLHAGLLVKL